jgi:hypothetical protein
VFGHLYSQVDSGSGTLKDIAAALGTKWRALPDAEKKVYYDKVRLLDMHVPSDQQTDRQTEKKVYYNKVDIAWLSIKKGNHEVEGAFWTRCVFWSCICQACKRTNASRQTDRRTEKQER